MSSKDNDKYCVMHSKSDNMKTIINYKADKVTEEIFLPFLSKYQIGLKTLMKGSDSVVYFVHLLYYKCQKINLNCGRSLILLVG